MEATAGTAAARRRLCGVGFIGDPRTVSERIDLLMARYGRREGGVREDGAFGCVLRPAFGGGPNGGGVRGYFLAGDARRGWTLDLFARIGGRLIRIRSVVLGGGPGRTGGLRHRPGRRPPGATG